MIYAARREAGKFPAFDFIHRVYPDFREKLRKCGNGVTVFRFLIQR